MGNVSVDKIYLLSLDERHRNLLRHAHVWAHEQLQRSALSSTTDRLVELMVRCFDSWHTQTIRAGTPGGYGGFMRPQLVKQFLNELGRSAMRQQMATRIDRAAAQPPQHTLEGVD